MASQYARWPVTRLKRVLSERGAITRGRKEQLVERLEAYDRTFNFVPEPIVLPQPDAVDWPQSGFQQLQSMHVHLLPKITKEQIEPYFIFRLAGDKHAASDVKALVKGRLIKDAVEFWPVPFLCREVKSTLVVLLLQP
ncbi:uncharacterized protein LOC130050167 [Ostrea edulis]|uniref:uncharacterized protein LOC130050167 n=1 Tax=Ostrea edulis TaxID=37623 RepID=UPI0024AFABE2|nr:uncharacterized protein LOC130050167 [Ostrea edulis]